MALENLSKEQLINLLKTKDVTDEEQGTCKFISRNTNKKCSDNADTPWGYCNKHKKSLQSKKEEKIWREKDFSENEQNDNLEQNNSLDNVQKDKIDYNNPLDSEGVKLYEDINNGNIEPSTNTMFFNTGGGYASNNDLRNFNPNNTSDKKSSSSSSSSTKPKSKSKTKKVKKNKVLKIGRNRFGRFEEPKSHLLFDPETHTVYGVQDQTGKVLKLTPKHYELCRRKGWKFYEEEESSESDSELESEESTDESSSDGDSENESEDDNDMDYY